MNPLIILIILCCAMIAVGTFELRVSHTSVDTTINALMVMGSAIVLLVIISVSLLAA